MVLRLHRHRHLGPRSIGDMVIRPIVAAAMIVAVLAGSVIYGALGAILQDTGEDW